ncbi:MAG: DUF2971 domain-containing protein [Verrucomicrobiia bacterium]
MPLLYKYIPPKAEDGTPLPELILQTLRMSATDPRKFNDPFEVRPWFDQERQDHFVKSHESFYEATLGIKHSLMQGRSMVGIHPEDAVGFGESLNKRFIDELGEKFRVLCFSRNPKSVLMWSHYTSNHAGIVIGIETSIAGFPQGLKTDGFEVRYDPDRSKIKLPLAYYQSPSVESYDLRRNIANRPDEPVISGGGLIIPFREYHRQIEEARMNALTTKAQDWHYEEEVRFIYDLSQHSSQLVIEKGRHLVSISPNSLREIIIGFRADVKLVQEIVRLYRDGKIGKPRLFFSECHPNLYEVLPHETNDQYLLDYFQIVLPNS